MEQELIHPTAHAETLSCAGSNVRKAISREIQEEELQQKLIANQFYFGDRF